MNGEQIRIAELGKIVTGKTPSTGNASFFEGDYLFVTPSDLDWESYYCRTTERTVSGEAKRAYNNQFIPPDSVMVTCIGNTLGKCGISSDECLTNQQINSIIPTAGVSPKFVYYLMLFNKEVIRGIGLGGGSATPILNKTDFSNTKIQVPPRKSWETIATILSAYDDLIENNRRRIQLLENAARLLYKEWFVNLRFPGHEHVRIKNGVPEGWKREKLGEVVSINKETLPSNFQGEIEYVDISSVVTGHIQNTTMYPFQEAPGRARRVVMHGDVIWSCVRPNRRSYAVIWSPPDNLIVSTGFAVLTPLRLPTSYLYQATTTDEFVGHLTNSARGVAYPAVTAKDFENAEVVVPDSQLLANYNDMCEPVLKQIAVLSDQNKTLKKARAILLPRLMNGDISV